MLPQEALVRKLILLLPEALVRKVILLSWQIAGIAFMVVGGLSFIIGIVLLFSRAQNSLLGGGCSVGFSILQIAIGFIAFRFVPGFMLRSMERSGWWKKRAEIPPPPLPRANQ